MEENKQRRQYDKKFKREAAGLVVEGNRRASEVARDPGIEANMLHRWKREYAEGIEGAFPRKGEVEV